MKKIISVIILLSLFSCKKKVDDENPELIGYWRSFSYDADFKVILSIEDNSEACYIVADYSSGAVKDRCGKARTNDKKLKIGRFYHFDIMEPPHLVDTTNSPYVSTDYTETNMKRANWEMRLSGLKPDVSIGGPLTFYKVDY